MEIDKNVSYVQLMLVRYKLGIIVISVYKTNYLIILCAADHLFCLFWANILPSAQSMVWIVFPQSTSRCSEWKTPVGKLAKSSKESGLNQ